MTAAEDDDVRRAQLQAAGLRAEQLAREIARFETRWASRPSSFTPFPAVSWEQLEAQVGQLAASPRAASIARDALSGWRAIAWTLPPEMLLREVLIVAWAAMDETFVAPPEPSATPATPDPGEGLPMP